MLDDLQSLEQGTRQHVVDELLSVHPHHRAEDVLADAAKLTAYILDGTLPEKTDTSLAPARPAAF